jgi:integrase/recombinase XerD
MSVSSFTPKRGNKRIRHPNMFQHDGTLWGRFKINGTDHKFSTGIKLAGITPEDYKVAAQRIEERRKQAIVFQKFKDAQYKFEEFTSIWESIYLAERSVSDKTILRYNVSLNSMAKWLNDKFVHQINDNLIDDIVKERIQQGVTVATIKRDLGALASVPTYAKQKGLCATNPAAERLENLRERRDPITLPDPHHVDLVIERAPGLFKALIMAAWCTGCRQDELVQAKRSAINHEHKQLTVVGKRNKLRVIDLRPYGGYKLISELPAHIKSDFLFWHDDGEPYRNVASHFYRLVHVIAATCL